MGDDRSIKELFRQLANPSQQGHQVWLLPLPELSGCLEASETAEFGGEVYQGFGSGFGVRA